MSRTRVNYKEGIDVVEPLPTGNGGDLVIDNFKAIADYIETAETNISNIQATNTTQANQISTLQSDLSTAQTNITTLQGASHSAVTIGTANGLSLATQALSLAVATTSTAGAMSASDKTKLDGYSSTPPTSVVVGKTIITGNGTEQIGATFTIPANRLTTSDLIRIRVTTAIGTSAAGEYGLRWRINGGSWLSNVGRSPNGAICNVWLDLALSLGTSWVGIFQRWPTGGSSSAQHQAAATIATPSNSHTIDIAFMTPNTYSETIYFGTLEIVKG